MSQEKKLSLPALIALVVGSMVGAGVFSLPATFGRATGGFGALIAWAIAGTGMLMLAFVFQTVSNRKPELDAGVYAYAKAGFGDYMGFASALGFWAGSCVGNVSYFVLIKSTLGAFFPVFGEGNTFLAIALSSMLLWGFHFLILRGVKEATAINTIVTFAKIIPILIFVVVAIFAFKSDMFVLNFWGTPALSGISPDLLHLDEYGQVGHAAQQIGLMAEPESLYIQVRSTMLVTVFVFLGIEGASVYSRLAKNRSYVGTATVVGFIGVLCLFMLVTMLSYGVMLRPDLAGLRQPSMAGVLESIVGPWGLVFVSVGLIVSVLGAYLSWALLAAEVLFSAAKNKSMPAFLAKESAQGVPVNAMWLTSGLIQIVLVMMLFTTYAFTLALELTSALSLIPYLFVAAYGLKLACASETYEGQPKDRQRDMIIAGIATVYSFGMIYAGGMKYILLSTLIYGPGTFLFYKAKTEQGLSVFTAGERIVFGLVAAGVCVAVYSLATGLIVI